MHFPSTFNKYFCFGRHQWIQTQAVFQQKLKHMEKNVGLIVEAKPKTKNTAFTIRQWQKVKTPLKSRMRHPVKLLSTVCFTVFAGAVWQMRQKDWNPTLWRKADWLGRRIIIFNPFKCQTEFGTLCIFCQTMCSNLISIIELDSTSRSKCLLEINWWFSVRLSDKVDSGKTVYFTISPIILSVSLCNEVLLNYIVMGWKQLLLVYIPAHPPLLFCIVPLRSHFDPCQPPCFPPSSLRVIFSLMIKVTHPLSINVEKHSSNLHIV